MGEGLIDGAHAFGCRVARDRCRLAPRPVRRPEHRADHALHCDPRWRGCPREEAGQATRPAVPQAQARQVHRAPFGGVGCWAASPSGALSPCWDGARPQPNARRSAAPASAVRRASARRSPWERRVLAAPVRVGPASRRRRDRHAATASATAARQTWIVAALARAAPTSRAAPIAMIAAVRSARVTSAGSATRRSPTTAVRMQLGHAAVLPRSMASRLACRGIPSS